MRMLLLPLAALLLLTCACSDKPPVRSTVSESAAPAAVSCTPPPTPAATESPAAQIEISVGEHVFVATLSDSPAAQAFAARLPMTLQMDELNGNEKYHYLSAPLPDDAESPGAVHAGDLMLYGADCLVLFYADAPTAYRYTRIGTIDAAAALGGTLGTGQAQVTFSVVDFFT